MRWQLFGQISKIYFGGNLFDGGYFAYACDYIADFSTQAIKFELPMFYPFGKTMALEENFLLPGLTAKVINIFTDNSILSLNLIITVTLLLNGYITYRAAKLLGCGTAASSYAGFVFMHYPLLTAQIHQPQVQFAFFIPLTFLLLLSFLQKPRFWMALTWGLSTTLSALCSVYYFAYCLLLSVTTLATYFLLKYKTVRLKTILTLACGGAIGLAPAYILTRPYHYANFIFSEAGETKNYGTGFLSYFSAPRINYFWGEHLANLSHLDASFFCGATVLLLALYYIFHGSLFTNAPDKKTTYNTSAWVKTLLALCLALITIGTGIELYLTGRTWTTLYDVLPFWILLILGTVSVIICEINNYKVNLSPQLSNIEIKHLLLLGFIFFVFASLGIAAGSGDSISLYSLLMQYIPGFKHLPNSARIGILSIFFLACFGGLALDSIICSKLKAKSLKTGFAVGVFFLTGIELLSPYYPTHYKNNAPEIYNTLASFDDNLPAISLPFITKGLGSFGHQLNQSSYIWWLSWAKRRFVNGYSENYTTFHQDLLNQTVNFPDQQSISALSRIYGLTYIVYHPVRNSLYNEKQFLEALSHHQQSIQILSRDNGGNFLLKLTPTLLNKSETIYIPPGKQNLKIKMRLIAPDYNHSDKGLPLSLATTDSNQKPLGTLNLLPSQTWQTIAITIPSTNPVQPSPLILNVPTLQPGWAIQYFVASTDYLDSGSD